MDKVNAWLDHRRLGSSLMTIPIGTPLVLTNPIALTLARMLAHDAMFPPSDLSSSVDGDLGDDDYDLGFGYDLFGGTYGDYGSYSFPSYTV